MGSAASSGKKRGQSGCGQWLPPAESWTCDKQLPYGWEAARDPAGRPYFINHVLRVTRRPDPRHENEYSESPPTPRIVSLSRDPELGFGFVAGSERPVVVRFVTEDGPSVGKLLPGDEILRVDDEDVSAAQREHVISLVKSRDGEMTVTVRQPMPDNSSRKSALLTAAKKARLKERPSHVRFVEAVSVNGSAAPSGTHESYIPCMPNVLKVFLENEQTKSFKYDAKTTVKDVLQALREKLSLLQMEHFALVLQNMKSAARWRLSVLQEHENLAEIAARPGSRHFRCLFRVAFVPLDAYDLFQADPAAFEYFYVQCRGDVLGERFAAELKPTMALRLAALHVTQHVAGNGMPGRPSLKHVEKEFGLEQFVPRSVLETLKPRELRRTLGAFLKSASSHAHSPSRHESSSGGSSSSAAAAAAATARALQAKLHYLRLVAELRSYGTQCYMVTLLNKHLELMMLVGPKCGVSVVTNIKNYQLDCLSEFQNIERLQFFPSDGQLSSAQLEISLCDKPCKIGLSMLSEDVSDFVARLEGYKRLLTGDHSPLLLHPQRCPVGPGAGKSNCPDAQKLVNGRNMDERSSEKSEIATADHSTTCDDHLEEPCSAEEQQVSDAPAYAGPHRVLASSWSYLDGPEVAAEGGDVRLADFSEALPEEREKKFGQSPPTSLPLDVDVAAACEAPLASPDEALSSNASETAQTSDGTSGGADPLSSGDERTSYPTMETLGATSACLDARFAVSRLSTFAASDGVSSSTIDLRASGLALDLSTPVNDVDAYDAGDAYEDEDEDDADATPVDNCDRPQSLNALGDDRTSSFGLHSPQKPAAPDDSLHPSYNPRLFCDGGLYLDPDIIDLTLLPPPKTPDADVLVDFSGAADRSSPPPAFSDGPGGPGGPGGGPGGGGGMATAAVESRSETPPAFLNDLPDPIRRKIDAMVRDGEDLASQLSSIEALVFAERDATRFPLDEKRMDTLRLAEREEKESGIESESDSGNETIISENVEIPPGIDTRDIDAFIAKVRVPPPPPLNVNSATCHVAAEDDVTVLEDEFMRYVIPPPPGDTTPSVADIAIVPPVASPKLGRTAKPSEPPPPPPPPSSSSTLTAPSGRRSSPRMGIANRRRGSSSELDDIPRGSVASAVFKLDSKLDFSRASPAASPAALRRVDLSVARRSDSGSAPVSPMHHPLEALLERVNRSADTSPVHEGTMTLGRNRRVPPPPPPRRSSITHARSSGELDGEVRSATLGRSPRRSSQAALRRVSSSTSDGSGREEDVLNHVEHQTYELRGKSTTKAAYHVNGLACAYRSPALSRKMMLYDAAREPDADSDSSGGGGGGGSSPRLQLANGIPSPRASPQVARHSSLTRMAERAASPLKSLFGSRQRSSSSTTDVESRLRGGRRSPITHSRNSANRKSAPMTIVHPMIDTSDAANLVAVSRPSVPLTTFGKETPPPPARTCDVVRYNEAQIIASKTYSGEETFAHAQADVEKLLQIIDSVLRKRNSSPTTDNFAASKELLITQSRQFVTDSKLLVSSATQSRDKLIGHVGSSLHTLARIVIQTELTAQAMSRTSPQCAALALRLKDVTNAYRTTVGAAEKAAGKSLSDQNMKQLMRQATQLAAILSTLMKTLKVLEAS